MFKCLVAPTSETNHVEDCSGTGLWVQQEGKVVLEGGVVSMGGEMVSTGWTGRHFLSQNSSVDPRCDA